MKFLNLLNKSICRGSGANLNLFRYAAMVVVLLMLGVGNAWAGASTTMRTKSTNTGQGLVYMAKGTTSAPALNAYKETSDDVEQSTSSGGVANFIAWAKPARGYKFSTWADGNGKYTASDWPKSNSSSTQALNTDPSKWDGVHDTIQGGNGGQASTNYTIRAYFVAADDYDVTYAIPAGGSYSIKYTYLTINSSTAFEEKTDNYSMTPTSEEDLVITSYAADEITLTVPNEVTNFIGWYEGNTQKSTNKTYSYTAHADVTVYPMFKELAWGDASGDLTTNVTAKGTYGGKTVYVALPTLIGSWSASDFTVAPMNPSNEFGSIAIGTISLDKTNSRLVIPYTYTATNWGGVEATFTITPSFGPTKQFSVACSAEEIVDYEACIEENEVRTYTGTLAEMMTQANSMNNQPTLKLMQDKTITAPLSFTNSFTFDVNGKVLTANCASAFSIDAAGKDVKIIDGSFTQVGEIHTSHASSGVVSVVTFTQAAKLTMQGGTLSAENTGTGSAYGVNVCNGSIFFMSDGQLTVTGVSGAHGIHVATEDDYATLNGGSLTVSAPTQAYGLWSAGQSNITDATIDVTTTTGVKAYGVYINGGTSTLTTTAITADAKTTEAYGAYVNTGRLNGNGGSFTATAVTDKAYGIYVASATAMAMVQMNATVSATLTTGNGTTQVEVCGVNNKGTVSLSNLSVTATSATNYATAVNSVGAAVSTTIEGGTYTGRVSADHAYGLHHQAGTLNVDGGIFKAISVANAALGVRAAADGTIANATMSGETTGSGTTAYGFVGGVAEKNITLSNCTIKAKSKTSIAYAIYNRANLTVTNCELEAQTLGGADARGFHADTGTGHLTNCNATVTSYTTQAYGVYHKAGSLTINGGQFDVTASQTTATAAQNSELYGLYQYTTGLTTTVNSAAFHANAANTAYSQKVYGAYINGTLNSTNGEYTARGKTTVYGIYGLGSSSLNLIGNNVESTVVNGTASYGIYAMKNFTINGDIVSAVGNATDIYALFFDASTSKGEVLDGKFSAQGNNTNGYGPLNANGTVGNVKLKGGVAKTVSNLKKYAVTGYDVYTLDDTHPDYAAGYRYAIATENPSQYVCYIKNGNRYESLAAALQYTKDNSGNFIIIMTQNHTLPAGDYELPYNATLIVPRNASQNTLNTNVPKDEVPVVEMLEEHLRLTMASGAHLNVSGKIEVGGKLYSKESGQISYPNSPYARIYMENGSLIQLNDGARLYAWGFITGSGSITAKSGSEVHEMFQVGDMPAISPLGQYYLNNSAKYFPVQVYSIKNIEVPTTYYYNSQLITAMYEYNPGSLSHGYNGEENIKLIGKEGAMFLVTTNDESSWVRKSYQGGKQLYEVNSSAKLGSLRIDVGGYVMDSRNYILPITATMKIHLLDGNMEITQSTMFQPGTQVEINKTATLKINSSFKDGDNTTQELKVYVIDQDQWRTSTTNPDAAWNVHGKIEVEGKLYTTNKGTTTKTDGANIYSANADAGTVSFTNAATADGTLQLVTGASGGLQTKTVDIESIKLKNGDGSYAETEGTNSGEAWVYMNNQWQKTYTNGCFEVIGSTVYAKPSEYVALTNTAKDANNKWIGVAESNHTYAAEGGKILILMDECQWWEVKTTDDPAVFECKKTGYEGFYYYDDTSSKWKLKTVNVKFYSAETGDNVLKTIVTDYNGIPDQAVIASNPTKETTAEFTYTFYGWKSSVTGDTIKWTDQLEVAKADMSYRPVFTKTKRNYTITLNDANNGATVYLEVPYGDMPEYTPVKAANAQYTYTFTGWNTPFVAVNGTATYTAQWSSVINRYTITWMDGETVLETDKNQLYGTTTSFDGVTPTKEADDNCAYAFSGWLNSLTGNMRANNETVTGAITYTAQYNTTPRYMITFANYDGTQLQKEAVTQGEPPIYNGLTPGRTRDLDGYYIFTGWKRNSTGVNYAPNDVLPDATEKETYTAQYSYTNDLFTITLNNVDGNGASWSGKFGVGAMPFYNRDNNDVAVEPAQASTGQYEYTFTGWSPELQVVSGEATYTAQFEQHTRKYEITFANLDGNGASQTIEVEYGQTPVSPVTPEKVVDHSTYAFTGWNTDIVPVTGEATYTAKFSSIGVLQQFTITFDPDNGGATQVTNVAYGTMPTWSGAEPTKPATAQYTYTFAGWYPDVAPVTGEETYSAQYTQTLNSYTVTFMDRGETLLSSSFQYGTTPTKPAEPKAWVDNDHDIAYSFAGWSDGVHVYAHNAIPTVSGDVTYTAQYTEFANLVATVTASSGTTPYNSWSTAYSNRENNCTIKLYKNVTGVTTMQALDKTGMTLDLNGYTFSGTCASNRGIISVTAANVTITDSSEGKTGTISGSANLNGTAYTLYINGGSLTIDYASVSTENTRTRSTSNAYGVYVYSGSVVINDGKFKATSGRSSGTKSAVNISSGQTATIKGGYYSNSVTAATGYECVSTSELSGYTHKVTPKTNINYTVKHWKQNVADDAYTEVTADAQTLQGTTDTYTEAEAKNYTGFTAQPFAQAIIAGDGKTVVNIYYNRIEYTVTWKDMTLSPQTLQEQSLRYGATIPAFDYQKQADEQFAYTMLEPRWKCSGENVTAQTTVNGDMELRAQYDAIPLTLVVTGVRTIDGTVALNSTTVRVSGALRVSSGTLTTTDLILEAQANTSGEITGNVQLNPGGHAYFDLYINDTEPRHWHAFSVPFQIDLRKSGHPVQINGETLTLGRGYDIVFYDGAVRAAQGKVTDCWKYVEDPSSIGGGDSILYPGKAYMIASASRTIEVVRFTKADGASLAFSGTINVTGGDGDNGGWNGIGNPTTYHAIMEAGPTVAQVHDGGKIGADRYIEYDIDDLKYVVGKAVYVQARSDKSVVISPASTQDVIKPAAPARHNARADINKEYLSLSDYYKVSIAQENNANTCNVYVLDEEDKEDAYVIGHDLSKFGLNTALLQMWVNRYDNQLSLNTTAPIDGVAYYPLGINAPQSCEYTISLQSSIDDEHALYLTCDGEVIWNLSEGAFLLYLDKGTTSRFGLRLVEKAPQVATGMDEAVLDAQGETQKILINDHVYIIRGNNVYTIDGQLVK